MIYACVAFIQATFHYTTYRLGKVKGVCRSATLVEHHIEAFFGSRKVEHSLTEVLAKLRIEPRGTQYDVLASRVDYILLAFFLRTSIDAYGCALLVLPARSVVWFFAKDIVGTDMHQSPSLSAITCANSPGATAFIFLQIASSSVSALSTLV